MKSPGANTEPTAPTSQRTFTVRICPQDCVVQSGISTHGLGILRPRWTSRPKRFSLTVSSNTWSEHPRAGQYHASAEEKFENGGPNDVGPTTRRHLVITGLGFIGKEAKQVGDAGGEDAESEAVAEFGRPSAEKWEALES